MEAAQNPASTEAVPETGTTIEAEATSTPDGKAEDEQATEDVMSVDTVQQRLEDLLSKRSIADDAFLVQHMNAQMYIPLAVLAAHYKMSGLGGPESLHSALKLAAQRSDKVGVSDDGMMVRPLLKPRRNTLILRDLQGFPEEELQALFSSSPESEAFVGLKPDVNNTAFATFKTDEAAQNVAVWLRSQKFQGAEIKCAVKSEHFVRSFFPASPGPSMQASPYMMPWGYPAWMAGGDANGWSPGFSYQADPKAAPKGDSKKGKGYNKGRKRTSTTSSTSLTDSGLEALPPAAVPQDAPSPAWSLGDEVAAVGYTHTYRKLSRQYIIDVCNKMENIEKPESYDLAETDGAAGFFRTTPSKEWAPLPTPMQTFAPQPSVDPEQESSQQRRSSWGPKNFSRNSRSQTEDDNWAHGDGSWWTGRGRSKTDQPQRWVEKAKTGKETHPESNDKMAEGAENASSSAEVTKDSASPTWADKVRQGTPSN